LSNVNKTKHKKKGKKVQDGWTQVQAKRRNHQLGEPQGEYEQIWYLIPLVTRSILDKERGGTHMKNT
jgi:hypothetical protein